MALCQNKFRVNVYISVTNRRCQVGVFTAFKVKKQVKLFIINKLLITLDITEMPMRSRLFRPEACRYVASHTGNEERPILITRKGREKHHSWVTTSLRFLQSRWAPHKWRHTRENRNLHIKHLQMPPERLMMFYRSQKHHASNRVLSPRNRPRGTCYDYTSFLNWSTHRL